MKDQGLVFVKGFGQVSAVCKRNQGVYKCLAKSITVVVRAGDERGVCAGDRGDQRGL